MPNDPKKDYVLDEIRSVKESVKDLSDNVNQLTIDMAEMSADNKHSSKQAEEIRGDIRGIKDTLIENTDSLNRHMRRTDLNEQMIVELKTKLTELEREEIGKKAINQWLKDKIVLSAKVAGALAAVAAILAYIPNLLKLLIAYSDIIK